MHLFSSTLGRWLPTMSAMAFVGVYLGCGSQVQTQGANGSGNGGAGATTTTTTSSTLPMSTSTSVANPTGPGLGGGPTGFGGSPTGFRGDGGGPPASACVALCALEGQCGASTTDCQPQCANALQGPCGAPLSHWLACITVSVTSCDVSACTAQATTYTACNQQQSETDAASSVAGSGGSNENGCLPQQCGFDSTGHCDCSQNCSGESLDVACDQVPGGAVCQCDASISGASGSCFQAADTCSTTAGCCATLFFNH